MSPPDPRDLVLALFHSSSRTSVFFPKTALKQGCALHALHSLWHLLCELLVYDCRPEATRCLEVMSAHLRGAEGCRTLPPYDLPPNLDRDAFIANSVRPPEWYAEESTAYELDLYKARVEWFGKDAFPQERMVAAVDHKMAIFDLLLATGSAYFGTPESKLAVLRTLLLCSRVKEAVRLAACFWPTAGTWRLRRLDPADSEALEKVTRLLVHALHGRDAEARQESILRLDELLEFYRRSPTNYPLGDLACRVEFAAIRRLAVDDPLTFTASIAVLRASASS